MADRDFYDVLGVSRGASGDDIRKAYKKLSRKFHPDKNPDDAEAETKFKEVQEAYAVLSNPDQRRQYDMFGHDSPGGSPFGSGGFEGVKINLDALFSGGLELLFTGIFGGWGCSVPGRRASAALFCDTMLVAESFTQHEMDTSRNL